MKSFETLFDHGEPARVDHPAYAPYGRLGFPSPPPHRPWIFTNFVQTLDGIASLKGQHSSGFDISRSEEDRWLMDLLRAHAGAVLYGIGTLIEETAYGRGERGPVFDLRFPECIELRRALGLGRERNIFVSGSGDFDLRDFRVFDGDLVDSAIVTTGSGAQRLRGREERPHVALIVAGDGRYVDLPLAMTKVRSQLGVEYMLCEGGPTLNGQMTRAGLVNERFLTISPVEAGPDLPPNQPRTELDNKQGITRRPGTLSGVGFTREELIWWEWISCRKSGSHQFNRYRKKDLKPNA